MRLDDLLLVQPGKISEDHVVNFLAMSFVEPEWQRVYYNPPSGSWKAVNLYHQGHLYSQVGPKRGVKLIKRPDLVVQDARESTFVRLFLMEAKVDRADWEPDLPEKMRAYFEGTPDGKAAGLRNMPFFHKRSFSGGPWKPLNEGDPDYTWFKDARVEYLYCFAYTLGRVRDDREMLKEKRWLAETAESVGDSYPSLFLCVCWRERIPEPRVLYSFNSAFPKEMAERVRLTLAHCAVK
jgi:hypothetical protein